MDRNLSAGAVSGELAAFAARLAWEDIPREVLARARHLILDAVGCALASRKFEFCSLSLASLSELAGKGDSVVIGQRLRLPLRDAAIANGILAHGLDYDDTHSEGIVHLTVSVFPAVLAVSSQANLSVREMLLAYVLGVEAGARLGAVAKGAFHQVGFHPTGVIGAFASALAAGKLYGLDAAQLAQAQGIALSVASGSLEFLVKTVCEPAAAKRKPANDYDAKFSLPYIIAASLIRGRFGLAELEGASLTDEAILSLAARVDYAVDPVTTFPRHYGGEVVVRLRDGRELRRREAVNRGSADRPLSNADIVAKFMDNASYGFSREKALEVRKAVIDLNEGTPARELAEALAER